MATPAVRRIIKEHGLDISQINGSGNDGRVLKEDVLKNLSGQVIEPEKQDTDKQTTFIVRFIFQRINSIFFSFFSREFFPKIKKFLFEVTRVP